MRNGQRIRGQVPRHARKRAAHGGAAGMARTHFGRQASGNGWLDGLQLGRAGKARAALGAQCGGRRCAVRTRSEEHTSELQSQSNLVCRLLLEKKKKYKPK